MISKARLLATNLCALNTKKNVAQLVQQTSAQSLVARRDVFNMQTRYK
ncbi:putative heat shock protein cognate 5-like [Homarus americanus]|nr:putative heat shock protein cognate 5-like [Homarus americanus]